MLPMNATNYHSVPEEDEGEKLWEGWGWGTNPMVPMLNGNVPLDSIMSAADAQMRIGWDPSESGNKTSPQHWHYLVQGEMVGVSAEGVKCQMRWWEVGGKLQTG